MPKTIRQKPGAGCSCFSEVFDDLGQWRGYGVSVAGTTLLIVGSEAGLLLLDAQALHSVFLVGDDLSGER